MIERLREIERLLRVTPFGVRFWDQVSGRTISEGLSVDAYPREHPGRRIQAFPNRSGIYVLPPLPEFRDLEYLDEHLGLTSAPQRAFVVEVNDAERRFVPIAFTAELPVRGLFAWEAFLSSPLTAMTPAVPLYSAPGRSVPASMAVLRAELWDQRTGGPASGALLEAWTQGRPRIRGLADEKGRVVLIFPYPEPRHAGLTSPLGSPPGGGRRTLREQTWLLQLQVFYSARTVTAQVPHLEEVLHQAPARVLEDLSPSTPRDEVTVSLSFGEELIVKTHSQSVLWILPAGSPL